MKYDREGNPIREASRMNEYAKAAEEQPQVFPNSPETESASEAPQSDDLQADDAQELPEDGTQGSPDETHFEPEPVVAAAVEEDSDAKKSFREVVRAKKQAERERDEYRQRMQELESRYTVQKPQAETAPVDEDLSLNLGADDSAEGKHLSKVERKIKKLEDQLAKERRQTTEDRAEALLRSKYADFDKVVSRDNIDMLSEAYPELARSLHATDDLYTKAVSAYTLIKKFGIYQESPLSSEKAQVLKNTAKPRPLTSVSPQQGDSPLARANAFASGLTDDLKSQLVKEMNQARKGY